MSKTAIISSTADLRFQGKPYPGCPLLLVDGRVEPAPSLWLFWVFRNRRASTADTYAKAIDLWFRALGTSGLRWWEVVPTDLEAFMAGLADAGASANTLRLRAAAVAQFYAWCHANGLIDRVAFTASSGRRHPGDMARAGTGRVSLPKTASRAVKSHTVEQFDAILGGLGRKLDLTLRRDELICEAGRYLGLRRSEVAGLRCSQFEDLDPTDEVQAILLDARTTKGGKARAVLAPRLYVQKVQRFIEGYRAGFVSSLQARNPAYRDPGLLFLNERGKNAGAGIDPAYVSKTWKAASKAAKIESRFHNNRASLGTAAADRAIASGEQPLVIVKGLLRHEREETAQIYVDQAALKNELLIRAKIVNDFYEAEPQA